MLQPRKPPAGCKDCQEFLSHLTTFEKGHWGYSEEGNNKRRAQYRAYPQPTAFVLLIVHMTPFSRPQN